jgi:putative tryptophan/tyrosine transport system substrate-binding protein
MKVVRTPYRNGAELERAIDAFAAESNGALLIVPPPPRGAAGELMNRLALKHRLPGIGASDYDSADTVMMSYEGDSVEPVRIAASYVDRILRGAKVSELPVQFPSKFRLVINLKTAKAIGLEIPATLTARADELLQ